MTPTASLNLAALFLSLHSLASDPGTLPGAPPTQGPQTLVQIRSRAVTMSNSPEDPTRPGNATAASLHNPSQTHHGLQIRRLSAGSLASLPPTEERVYIVGTQSDAIKGIRKYIVKGEYLPCDYEGCFLYACGYCKKTSGMLSMKTYTCPSVKLSRDEQRRTVMRTQVGDFCELSPKEKLDHFGDRTCRSVLSLGKGTPPAQDYSDQTFKLKSFKAPNPRVLSKFRAAKGEDISGKIPVLQDGTVDCTRLLLYFGIDESMPPGNPLMPLGGAMAVPSGGPPPVSGAQGGGPAQEGPNAQNPMLVPNLSIPCSRLETLPIIFYLIFAGISAFM